MFGEFPEFDTGTYTFLGDYVPWGGGDGMEHRNSTVVAAPVSLRTPGMVADVLDTVSHEFFHCWNVERIRPKTLEPFNFEEANISGELWLAEGFTQYYGDLIMARTGLSPLAIRRAAGLARAAIAVINDPGRQFRSAVEMSQMAPFTDAARAVDPTNFSTTFISYYTYGAAIALALDLSLRDRSNGKISLDDYMRAMWRVHGKPGGPQPGLVGKPYTLRMRARGWRKSPATAHSPTSSSTSTSKAGRWPTTRACYCAPACVLRKRSPGAAWIGPANLIDASGTINNLMPWGSPAFDAGLDQGDVIVDVDGKAMASGVLQAALKSRKPGDRLTITFKRRGGATGTATITLEEDPSLEAVTLESTGGTLTAEQKQFRESWLGSKVTP